MRQLVAILSKYRCAAISNSTHTHLYGIFLHRVAPLNPALTFLNSIHYHTADEANDASKVCMDHDHEKLKPQLISTWMPNGVGAMPGKRVIFAETQVSTGSLSLFPTLSLALSYTISPW